MDEKTINETLGKIETLINEMLEVYSEFNKAITNTPISKLENETLARIWKHGKLQKELEEAAKL